MSFMRLGTRIAVIDDNDRILLSKRGDFGIWALPGGRVDRGEYLDVSAVREVREETGLDVDITRPIGLYYQQGRSRMNILYRAKPIGGQLFSATDETLDNRFFAPDELPNDLFGKFYIDHAYTDQTHLHTLETSQWELLKIDLKLRWRWINNLLAGRPEPKFEQFTIRAFAVITHNDAVLLQDGNLPMIVSDGKQSLPDALSHKTGTQLNWRWGGIRENATSGIFDFYLYASAHIKNANWKPIDSFTEQHLNTMNFYQQFWIIQT